MSRRDFLIALPTTSLDDATAAKIDALAKLGDALNDLEHAPELLYLETNMGSGKQISFVTFRSRSSFCSGSQFTYATLAVQCTLPGGPTGPALDGCTSVAQALP